MDYKKEVIFSIDQSSWREFWTKNRDKIVRLSCNQRERQKAEACSELYDKPIEFTLSGEVTDLVEHSDIQIEKSQLKTQKSKSIVKFSWSKAAKEKFFKALKTEQEHLEKLIKFTPAGKKKFVEGKVKKTKYCFNVQNERAFESLSKMPGVKNELKVKESGKKAVLAKLGKNPNNQHELIEALKAGRSFFPSFQDFRKNGANVRTLLGRISGINAVVCSGSDGYGFHDSCCRENT